MRVDTVFVTDSSKISGSNELQSGQNRGLELSVGTVIEAKVVSNENGNVALRTPDGQLIRARLDSGVFLPADSEATLVVSEQREGVIYLSLAPEMSEAKSAANAPVPLQSALSAKLLPYINLMAELKIPLTEETLAQLRQVVREQPEISAERAVFLAANQFPDEQAEALNGLLSGEAKTAEMLNTLLEQLAAPRRNTELLQNAEFTQNVRLMQNAELLQSAETIQNTESPFIPPAAQQIPTPPDLGAAAQKSAPAQMEFDEWLFALLSGEKAQEANREESAYQALPQAAGQAEDGSVENSVLKLLSKMPSMQGMAKKNLNEISNILKNISVEIEKNDEQNIQDKLAAVIKELFVRPEDADIAEGLRKAENELYVRLSYIRENLARSDLPGKAVMLEQTQKLMDHVRLLNSVEQFVYMQLPLQINERESTAELFIYKQKQGRKRIDPDNVKVLLALDLMHMGHLEAFVEIKDKNVSLQLEVGEETVRDTIQENTIKLHKMLAEIGYKLQNTLVKVEKKETKVESALLSLLDYERRIGSGVDYTV